MWPLYAAAAGDDVPIWIHLQHGHSYPWLKKDLVHRLFGIARAAAGRVG